MLLGLTCPWGPGDTLKQPGSHPRGHAHWPHKELAKIFNGYFSTINWSDHHLEVTGSALGVQLYEMQHYGVKAEAFVSMYIETLFVDEFCV